MVGIKSITLLLLGGIFSSVISAQSGVSGVSRANMFDNFVGDGFYWYKTRPDPKPPKNPEPIVPQQGVPAKPTEPTVAPMSQKWLRENLPKLLDLAVDDPTPENVANYMYAQRVLLDKAQNFSQSVKQVVATDPFLDENNRVPVSQFAQVFQMREMGAARREILDHLSANVGLWVFVDTPDRCSACESYVQNVLTGVDGVDGIATRHNFNFKKIYVNTPEGRLAAQRLNLKLTPTTVMVAPPDKFFLVSQGLMAQDQLIDRLMITSRAHNLVPRHLVEKANPYERGILQKDQIDGLEANASPSEVMNALRNRIHGATQ